MSLCSGASPCSASRRGVLLLITVSMLTLFMMLGTAYLVVATRARESARALARRTLTADEARIDHSAMLDQVLLTVVRGTAAGQAVTTGSGTALAIPFESLLADCYGNASITGTWSTPAIYSAGSATALSAAGTAGPVVTGTFTMVSGSVAHPAHLNGRILTFTTSSRPPTSHRILRASREDSNSPFAVTLSNPPGPYQLKAGDLPTGRAIINGREFAGDPDKDPSDPNESWDGFDDKNAFLAHIKPDGVSRTTVVRPSYVPALTGALADNDNDGVPDGVFLRFGLPSIPISSGTSVQLDASVLIVDLDGRFNVNAHGSLANMPLRNSPTRPTRYDTDPVSIAGWTNDTSDDLATLADIPTGSGVGPAEVNATKLLSETAILDMQSGVSPQSAEQPGAALFIGTGTFAGERPTGSRYSVGEPTPRTGASEGRHGGQSAPALSETAFWTSLIPPLRDSHVARVSDSALRGIADVDLRNSATLNSGVPPLWWLSTSGTAFNWGAAGNNYPLPRSVYNSPPDLHGRMKTLTRPVGRETPGNDSDGDGRITYGIVPRVSYAKPEWSTTSDYGAEITGNPYQTRLRSTGTRGGYIHAPSTAGTFASPMPTNPFTVSELERLLRPYDIDVNQLPPRLAAILGTISEQMRTRLTSESWDTTAIVDGATDGGASPKGAWALIEKNLTLVSGSSASVLYGSGPLNGVLGGEVARGERFNLNRPLTGSKPATYIATDDYYVQRQAYFKDLYILLQLLDGDPLSLTTDEKKQLAQWAANVVDFRDADSTMTPFEYDTDIFNGWTVDGDITTTETERGLVFGSERPEALITHSLAWESDTEGELFIVIHRPWNAYAHASGSNKVPAETIDCILDSGTSGPQRNHLDFGRKSGATNSGTSAYPIWRLRIVADGETKYVRFDSGTHGPNEFGNSLVISGSATPKLGSDSWVCVRSHTNSLDTAGGPAWVSIPQLMQEFTVDTENGVPAQFKAPGPLSAADPPDWPEPRPGKIYLERLADPTSAPTASTWTDDPATTSALVRYVIVDQAPLQIVRRSPKVGTIVSDYTEPSTTNHRTPRLLQRKSEGNSAFWKTDSINSTGYNHHSIATSNSDNTAWSDDTRGTAIAVPFPSAGMPDVDVAWMPWVNRPFFSAVELLLVPKYSTIEMLENYRLPLAKQIDESSTLADGDPNATDLPRSVLASGTAWPIFDAVTVPSLFAAIHDSWVDSGGHLAAKTGIHQTTHPVNQLSSYREPGRVNLNTITNEQVWDAVVSGPLKSGAVISGTAGTASLAASPAKTMRDALALGTGSSADPLRLDSNQSLIVSGTTSALNAARNPIHRLYTAGRLANVATTRSNVFAIWVTLREQVPGDPDSVRYHRGFYVVDRSIPVGYEEGRNHNVRDTILLRRIIE